MQKSLGAHAWARTRARTHKLIKYINNIRTFFFFKNGVIVYDTAQEDTITFWLTAFNHWEFKIRS